MNNWLRISFAAIAIMCWRPPEAGSEAAKANEQELTAYLDQVFRARTGILVRGSPDSLDPYYVTTEKSGRVALDHEKKRREYIQAWALKRSLLLAGSKSEIRIVRMHSSEDTVRVTLVHRELLEYGYLNAPVERLQSFGLGTRHVLTLHKSDQGWKIKREWYLDPLEENPDLISDSDHAFPSRPGANQQWNASDRQASGKTRYDRVKAVRYANKYAGLAWGAGNQNRYNRKYRDYTGFGGDCTNFVSQVLGDPKEGGGLPMTSQWFANSSGGSDAWVRTDGFKNFLLYSGYGRLVVKGTFEKIALPTPDHPRGYIGDMQPGDLIGYELKKGDVDHFAVIVGFDENGYPLVNCHTTDRYRVPFDLGWDKTTKYLLFHIR
ncbi:amidase domain-containing protein [Cohnella xylanilytica]|uniref:Amidase domain-containing protein n=1 Tax=Cohnella xylanilytica TaxID=557555 RepID=A0A841U1U6_9BACL|nr:amidase domain-containing protein [Cohnella xylanilytica]